MRLTFVSKSNVTLGYIERTSDGSIERDKFGGEMLVSGWSPMHTTDEAIFERYASGWSRSSYVRVVRDRQASIL